MVGQPQAELVGRHVAHEVRDGHSQAFGQKEQEPGVPVTR
jgi:hypothetical protein